MTARMSAMSVAYSATEIDAIAGWLTECLTASQIADRLSVQRRCEVSRSAIIGLVHRNRKLAAIGLRGSRGAPRKRLAEPKAAKASASVKPKGPTIQPGNIANKRESRKLDPAYKPPKPAPQADGRSPYVYDAASRHVPLVDLGPRDCRFAVNDAGQGEQHLFCGMPQAPGEPYCRHHALRCRSSALTLSPSDDGSLRAGPADGRSPYGREAA